MGPGPDRPGPARAAGPAADFHPPGGTPMSRNRRSVWWLALALLAGPGPAARADLGLFVSSFFTNSVLEYNGTTGAPVGTFASGGGLSLPQGLVFGPNG